MSDAELTPVRLNIGHLEFAQLQAVTAYLDSHAIYFEAEASFLTVPAKHVDLVTAVIVANQTPPSFTRGGSHPLRSWSMLSTNAAPEPGTGDDAPPAVEIAGPARRAASAVIDIFGAWVVTALVRRALAETTDVTDTVTTSVWAVVIAVWLLAPAVAGGTSVGHQLVRSRVVSAATLRPPRWWKAFGRQLFPLALAILSGWAVIWDESPGWMVVAVLVAAAIVYAGVFVGDRRGLHDRLAGTLVVCTR